MEQILKGIALFRHCYHNPKISFSVLSAFNEVNNGPPSVKCKSLLQHLNNWTRASKITLTKKNGLFGKKSNCLITMTFSEMYIEYRYDTKKEY